MYQVKKGYLIETICDSKSIKINVYFIPPNFVLYFVPPNFVLYSETLNKEYIERIQQMSYSSLSDNGMLQIFSFLIKWLYRTL